MNDKQPLFNDKLIEALNKPEYDLRSAAFEQLRARIEKEDQHMAYLLEGLKIDNVWLRAYLIRLYTDTGSAALSPLQAIIVDPANDPLTRYWATLALSRVVGKQAKETLINLLDSPIPEVRGAAALALGHMNASDAVPDLVLHLNDDEEVVGSWWNPTVGHKVAEALEMIGTTESEQALNIWLEDHPDFESMKPR